MSDLLASFQRAQEDVKSLNRRPDDATLLQLYALFKQATVGDAGDERPGAFDFVRRAKYDAWNKLRGVSTAAAMQQYVELARELKR